MRDRPPLRVAVSISAALGLALSLPVAGVAEPPEAFVGARILPIAGEAIDGGVLVVSGGKIVAVGPAGTVAVPADSVVHDLAGKTLMPGLVDTHSHVGAGGGADESGPIQPETRILDALDVRDPGFGRVRAGGITTLNVMPGSGHLISGQTVYLKARKVDTVEEMAIRDDAGAIAGGLKMANGTNSQDKPPFPGTRGKSAALVREAWVKAQTYRDKLARAAEDPDKAPDRDLALEILVEALDGKRVVHHHTHRHDDILTVLRLKREFGFRVVLHHVSEAWKVADEIAAAGVPSSIIVIDSPGGKEEAKDVSMENGAALESAGALAGFHTDDGITDSRLFLRSAALAVRAGMSREGALYGMTLAGARMLDLEGRLGSLEPGKDADFIVLSGDPLSIYTHVLETWIEGRKVFDLSDPDDRLAAEGGWGAGGARDFHDGCLDGEEVAP